MFQVPRSIYLGKVLPGALGPADILQVLGDLSSSLELVQEPRERKTMGEITTDFKYLKGLS